MKNALALVAILAGHCCFAQCPFPVLLQSRGSVCLGNDTLIVSTNSILSKIVWYNGNTIDTAVTTVIQPTYMPNGVTVAGGNSFGSAANQLNSPTAVYADGSGNVYVADYENGRIQQFPPGSSSATNGVTVAGGNGVGPSANQLDNPFGLFVNGSGRFFVSDQGNFRIQEFPPGSTSFIFGQTVAGGNSLGSSANQFNQPSGVFVDGSGNLYVADEANARVQKFPPGSTTATNGVTVAGGNGPGAAANQLTEPYSVFVDAAGSLYVADFGNYRIQKFQPNSTSASEGITVAGGNGKGAGANQFNGLFSMYVDAGGNIYAADAANNRIQKFPSGSSSATNGITVAGGNGAGIGPNQLNNPGGVFVDGSGNIYVADFSNNRIQKFSLSTTIDTVFIPSTPGIYTAVVTDNSGCTATTNAITVNPVVTPAINIQTQANIQVPCTTQALDTVNFIASPANPGTAPVYQWQVNGVKAGTGSAFYTGILPNNSIVACTLTSNAVCATMPTALSNSITVTFGAPPVVTLVNKGNCPGTDTLIVNAPGNLSKIIWFNGNTVDTAVTSFPDSVLATSGVTVAGGNGQGAAANQLNYPDAVFADGSGNIYVADQLNNRIQKFPQGSTSATFATTVAGGNGIGVAANQFNVPISVYVAGSGNIYVADEGNNRIQKFPPGSVGSTAGVTIAGGNQPGLAANQFNGPYSVFVDGNGNVYVADAGNNRIQKFAPGSTTGITVAGGNGGGSAANQLNTPFCVFVDGGGNMYVADLGNERIQKFPTGSNSATNGITVAGGNGRGPAGNQLDFPDGVFVDANGNLYVADQLNNRIQKFPPGSTGATTGITIEGGNGAGSAANQLTSPFSVYLDGWGNMYVTDQGNNRIQKFSMQRINTYTIDTVYVPWAGGTYTAAVTTSAGCTVTTNAIVISPAVTPAISISASATALPACNTQVLDTISFTANATNGGGSPLYQWQVNGVDAGSGSPSFTAALANNSKVTCTLTSNAACTTTPVDTSNRYTVAFNTLTAPVLKSKGTVICAGSDTLFVSAADIVSKIEWYNGNTPRLTVMPLIIIDTVTAKNAITVGGGNGGGSGADQLDDPWGVFVDGRGNIYVPDYLNGRVQKFIPGSATPTAGVTVAGGVGQMGGPNQLYGPSGVYVDASGYIYVSDLLNGRVQKFPPNSTIGTNAVTIAGGNGTGASPNQLNAPTSVFVDGGGNLYVCDEGNHRVLEFPPVSTSATNGTIVAGGNGQGPAANQLRAARCVFVDGGGNMYIADAGNDRIQKFPAGSTSATSGITAAGGNGFGNAPNQLGNPSSVWVDGSGNIYVADLGNNRIQRFAAGAANGITVAGGNGAGNAANQLNSPNSVWVDGGGNIYVADMGNERIQEFITTITKRYIIDTVYLPPVAGTYTVVVTDSAGCTDTTNAIVISPSLKPAVTISADTTAACAGSPIMFISTAVNAGTAPIYQWMVNGESTGPNNTAYTTSALANGDVVACIVSGTDACIGVDTSNSIVATIFPLPVVGSASDVSISNGQSVTLTIPVTGNIASYLWSPPTGLNNNTIANPAANPGKTTTYTLQVVSVNGCTAEGYIKVVIPSPVMLPSAFTPNSDGHNDIFYVLGGYAGDKIKQFTIFNRWGQKLFQVQDVAPNDPGFGWNGTFNGMPQPPGGYVYIAVITSADGTEQTYKGTVVLLR